MNKAMTKDNFYIIKDSFIVLYKEADKKRRPYLCLSHSKKFCVVVPITSQKGNERNRNRRVAIPQEIWKFQTKSYLQIYDSKIISNKTPYFAHWKVSKKFSLFLKDTLDKHKPAKRKIKFLEEKMLIEEEIAENGLEY